MISEEISASTAITLIQGEGIKVDAAVFLSPCFNTHPVFQHVGAATIASQKMFGTEESKRKQILTSKEALQEISQVKSEGF